MGWLCWALNPPVFSQLSGVCGARTQELWLELMSLMSLYRPPKSKELGSPHSLILSPGSVPHLTPFWHRPASRALPPFLPQLSSLLALLPGSLNFQPPPTQALASPASRGQLDWMLLPSTQGPLWDTQQGGDGQQPSFTSLPASSFPSVDLPLVLPPGSEAC